MKTTLQGTDGRGRRPLLRLSAAIAAGAILALIAPGLAQSQQSEDFIAGSGNAYAQVVRVAPTAALLSLAPVIGDALADYTDTVARGAAEDANLAAIGVASPCTDADVPRVRVSSEDKDAEKGVTNSFGGSEGGGIGTLFARATKAPFGESRFRFGDFEIPGVMKIGQGVAYASSGIAGDGIRRSTSIVDISDFNFGGAVTLKGLHWEAVQQTGDKGKKIASSFSMQGANIGLLPIPVSDMAAALKQITAAIAPTGFSISLPVNDSEAGVASMSPLTIQIVNSALGREFLGPVLAAAQPIREPLADQLIPLLKQPKEIVGGNPNDCDQTTAPDLSVAVLAADLGIGIAAGSSDLHFELGGVNAYTEGQKFANAFGPGEFNPPNVDANTLITVPGTKGTPGTPGFTPTNDEGTLTSALPPTSKTVPGGKGGAAIAVGLVGLAVAIVLAGADWYRMRRHRAQTT